MVFFIFETDLNYAYKSDRGAHFYWLKKKIVEARPDHVLNLIHYEVIESSYYKCVSDILYDIFLASTKMQSFLLVYYYFC